MNYTFPRTAEQEIVNYYITLKKKDLTISLAETVLLWLCNGKGEEFRKKWFHPFPKKMLN